MNNVKIRVDCLVKIQIKEEVENIRPENRLSKMQGLSSTYLRLLVKHFYVPRGPTIYTEFGQPRHYGYRVGQASVARVR